jgi:hypothetical protein
MCISGSYWAPPLATYIGPFWNILQLHLPRCRRTCHCPPILIQLNYCNCTLAVLDLTWNYTEQEFFTDSSGNLRVCPKIFDTTEPIIMQKVDINVHTLCVLMPNMNWTYCEQKTSLIQWRGFDSCHQWNVKISCTLWERFVFSVVSAIQTICEDKTVFCGQWFAYCAKINFST